MPAISMALMLILQAIVLAYTYGRLTSKVEAIEKAVNRVCGTVDECPYCHNWRRLKLRELMMEEEKPE